MLSAYLLCRESIKENGSGDRASLPPKKDVDILKDKCDPETTKHIKDNPQTKDYSLSLKDEKILLPFMAAIEMIHSSSLVHDDLPCMDNDSLRRGHESTWARYGEDIGTLAGDGLMIYAFETACKSSADPRVKIRAIEILAEKSGIFGMIGGQTQDVELTGRALKANELEFIYAHKTAALIEASFMIGAVLAGADKELTDCLLEAGRCIGLAFQIEDDILDIIGTREELGKSVGSDKENKKFTWVSCYGMKQARQDVDRFTNEALKNIRLVGNYSFLEKLVKYLTGRRS